MDDFFQMISRKELEKRIRWIINLRWLAAIGVFTTLTVTQTILELNLPYFYLYLGNVVLILSNVVYMIISHRINMKEDTLEWHNSINRFANIQISLDLILLTYLIYFSGSLENPFVFYYVFHMVIASILLSNRAAYLQASLAVVLMGAVMIMERLEILPHIHIWGFVSEELFIFNNYYNIGAFFVFSSTLYITVYFATTIVNRLRYREKQLQTANKKLKEQDRVKSRYVLIVSHDIQASLSSIQSCLNVVLEGITGSISRKSKEMVRRAEQRTYQLLDFVKDLLDLSRMRASESIVMKRVPLFKIINNVIRKLKQLADKKEISLSLKDGAESIAVLANPEMLEELMSNLIANSIKYTPEGGVISISIQNGEPGNYVRISVTDTGIGIPREDTERIFEDFFRAPNAKQTAEEGTGLGLSIAKHIVEIHGGKIWVDSEIREGSTFSFTLQKNKIIKEGKNDVR